MEKSNLLLPDVSLCAIVRDEKMNPAGGIEDFVDCIMPFVEKGVIVDTGSKDGTREILEELESKYSNLKIYDKKFKGYADARNHSLRFVNTTQAFVLDADERITKEDIIKLRQIIENEESYGYNFGIKNIFLERDIENSSIHNPRLFRVDSGFRYKDTNRHNEWLMEENDRYYVFDYCFSTNILIKHFLSSIDARVKKQEDWYSLLNQYSNRTRIMNLFKEFPSISDTPSFKEWKELNPKRAEYNFGI
jgi:glycosyltransferase involved in cell wall biosynthesis